MLGIIGAMDVEICALKNMAEKAEVKTVAGIDFVSCTLEGVPACIAQCRPGKVNAALCTQIMIDLFSPGLILNIGVGCSLSKEVTIKDMVIASEVCQYDFDTSAVDGVKGLIFDDTVKLPTDKEFSHSLIAAAEDYGARVHYGCVATGDTFIGTQKLKDEIVSDFGAICGEMEGGAIGQVCYVNKIPFAVLRSVSDGGDESVAIDYPVFKEIAAKQSSAVVLSFLRAKK